MLGNNGMMMMLKSMGFDPEQLKQNIETFKTDVTNGINTVDNRLAAIEKQQKQILFFVEQLYNACVNQVESPQTLASQAQSKGMIALTDYDLLEKSPAVKEAESQFQKVIYSL